MAKLGKRLTLDLSSGLDLREVISGPTLLKSNHGLQIALPEHLTVVVVMARGARSDEAARTSLPSVHMCGHRECMLCMQKRWTPLRRTENKET